MKVFATTDTLRKELLLRSLTELKAIAKQLPVAFSRQTKGELIENILNGDRTRLKYILGPVRTRDTSDLVITAGAPISARHVLLSFLTVFGGIWLLLEPISSFTTGARVLSYAGWWGYLSLIGSSIFIVGIYESRRALQHFEKHIFVSFFLVFPNSGCRIQIHVPRDMQIESFLRLLASRSGFNRLFPVECTCLHLYTHNLMVKSPRGFKPVNSNLTFQEAGIVDGTICRLRGYIRAEYTLPLLDIEYSWQPARLAVARAAGLVLLDELDSVSYEQVKADRLISETAMARVDRFEQKHGGEFFVVICPIDEIDDVPELAARGEVP